MVLDEAQIQLHSLRDFSLVWLNAGPIFVLKDVKVSDELSAVLTANVHLLRHLELDFSDLLITLSIVNGNQCIGHLIRIEDVLLKTDHHFRTACGAAAFTIGEAAATGVDLNFLLGR